MTAVLDASAVLALLFDEPGAEAVVDHITAGTVISTVNLAEVANVLVRNGRDPSTVLQPLRAQVEVLPFTDSDAITAAELYPLVSRGLSLGDRTAVASRPPGRSRSSSTTSTSARRWTCPARPQRRLPVGSRSAAQSRNFYR